MFSDPRQRLTFLFLLTVIYFVIEFVTGYVTHCLVLTTHSFHWLSDMAALSIAFLSLKTSPQKGPPGSDAGWARAEVLGALVSSVFLIAVCISVLVEALQRFYLIEEVTDEHILLYIGTLSLIVSIVGAALCRKRRARRPIIRQVNMKRVSELVAEKDAGDKLTNILKMQEEAGGFEVWKKMDIWKEILKDTIGPIFVIINALYLWLSNTEDLPRKMILYRFYCDPCLSILLVVLMMVAVWPLFLQSALILLQTVPANIDVESLQEKLLNQVDGILGIRELRVWQLAGDQTVATAHLRCRNLPDFMRVAEKTRDFFRKEGIDSATIQPEFVEVDGSIAATSGQLPEDILPLF